MAADTKPRVRWKPGPTGWMVICFLVPTLLYMVAVREPSPRWRAAYFSNERLEGVPLVRKERDVNHNWGVRRSPLETIRVDHFSARWDTCLVLERAQSVAFQLTSDDGSRLFIDGQLAIDNWGPRPRSYTRGSKILRPLTSGVDVPLQAGVHHLRVEYYEEIDHSLVTLLSSFEGERPQRIAPERLQFPDGDWQRPCKAAPAP